MERHIERRLDIMDVEIQTILKRQAYLLAAIAMLARTPDQLKRITVLGDEMVDSLSAITDKITEITKELENERKVGKA